MNLLDKIKENLFVFFLIRFLILPIIVFMTVIIFIIVIDKFSIVDNNALYFLGFLLLLSFTLFFWFFIHEIYKLHKSRQFTKRNINFLIISIYTIMTIVIYQIFVANEFMFSKKSPDGNYKIEVYKKKSLFAMPGSGGTMRMTKVFLKNKWGITIGSSHDNCSVFYDDIKISWDLKHRQVYFALTRSLNLDTGKCEF